MEAQHGERCSGRGHDTWRWPECMSKDVVGVAALKRVQVTRSSVGCDMKGQGSRVQCGIAHVDKGTCRG